MINPTFDMLNQRGTPMFFSDVFANRPTAAIVGRIFVSTDTYELYRDTGTAWDLLSGPGSGTITGSGTAFKYPVFTASSVIGNGSIEQLSTKNQSTRDFEIKTSTDDGLSESELILTNRFSGVDDTITFQYGRTILAGSPFLKIQDNSLTFPTSKLTYTGGNFTITDSLLVVTNTLQNNVADFIASAPELTISATGVGQRATLILAPSIGAFAGTIRTGSALNTLEFQTGIPSVTRLTIGATGVITINDLAGTGTRMIVASSTGVLSAQATPTIFGTLATGQVAFGSATDTISGSNNLFWDNTNGRLGIGTTSGTAPLTFGKAVYSAPSSEDFYRIKLQDFGGINNDVGIGQTASGNLSFNVGGNGSVSFFEGTNGERMRLYGITGNLAIGGAFASDTSQRLQVTGDAIISKLNSYQLRLTDTSFKWDLFCIANVTNTDLRFVDNSNNQVMTMYNGGNVSIGNNLNNAKLSVTGTAIITGASTFGGNMTLSLNQNGSTLLNISNTTSAVNSIAALSVISSGGSAEIGKFAALKTAYKIISANDGYVANFTIGDFAILNDFATGIIKFAAGGSSTAQMTLTSNGSLGIGSTSANASAILQLDSTTRGFLPPRMTSTERNAIGTLVAGLIVYDTTLNKLYVYTNAWEQITSI